MKRLLFLLSAAMLLLSCTESRKHLADRVFDLAADQFRLLDSELAEGECPRTLDKDGNLVKSDIGWWCSGFFPGSLWAVYEHVREDDLKQMAEKRTEQLADLAFRETDHDLGFQVGCSYINALRVTGDTKYMSMPVLAARRLAERFNPNAGCMRSWGQEGEPTFRVIIDNMMNLELIITMADMQASESMWDVAETHAQTTMKNHFRPDFSTWHLLEYDPQTGEVLSKKTVQGYSDDSMWARGEAWALYGFTMMYRKTSEKKYLNQAKGIADLLIRRLPSDGIPYWDFDDPAIPDAPKDASAAAIMSSAFYQLYLLTADKTYFNIADRQIRTLASAEYLSKPGENHGFLIKHCVGNYPAGSEVDVPLSYADYYFLEAVRMYGM